MMYAGICLRISCFANAGYQDGAADMVNEFKKKFSRKPAFVDELKKYRS